MEQSSTVSTALVEFGEFYTIKGNDYATWWAHGSGEYTYLIDTVTHVQLRVEGNRLMVCDENCNPLHDSGWSVEDLIHTSPDRDEHKQRRETHMAAIWNELLADIDNRVE